MGRAATPALRTFVRETLGCTCPESVFESVERSETSVQGGTPVARLVIGDRLLIYVAMGDPGAGRLAALAAAGLQDRDAHGLNRFRLVIGLRDAAAPVSVLEAACAAAVGGDPRAHLHCVPAAACDEALS